MSDEDFQEQPEALNEELETFNAAARERVLILVEGQTEERFVKDVLGPAFFDRKLFFHPTILITKRVKDGPNFKGGVTNFARFRNDAQRLLNGAGWRARVVRPGPNLLSSQAPVLNPQTGDTIEMSGVQSREHQLVG